MTPEQVEDAGWSTEEWSSLNELLARTVAEHAQLRRVLTEGPAAPNAYLVDVPTTSNGAEISFDVSTSRKVTRIHVDLLVKSEQLHDLPNIRTIVERAATRLARIEDIVLAHGDPARAKAQNGSVRDADKTIEGLFQPRDASWKSEPAPAADPRPIDAQLKAAVRALRSRWGAGALRAALGFEAFMNLAADTDDSRTGLERARHILGGPDALVVRAQPDSDPARDNEVAVFEPDPAALDLVWARPPHLLFVGTGKDGEMKLRVEEAFLLRIKDASAIAVVPQGPRSH